MSSTATLKWIGLALLGIAIAAAVAIAASGLVSRQIGLASEPISAGEDLAPAVRPSREREPSRDDRGGGGRPPSSSTSPPTVTAPPGTTVPGSTSPAPGDDAGGEPDADD